MKLTSILSPLYTNKYYFFGLALQKGIPFLVIPIITLLYTKQVYAEYILIYSFVLFVSPIICLGTVNSFIVFWHSNKIKSQYLSNSFFMVLVMSLFFGIIAGLLIYFISPSISTLKHSAFIIVCLIVYSVLYNQNTLGLNLLRAEKKQTSYFFSVLASSILLLTLLSTLSLLHKNIFILLFAYMMAMFVQIVLFHIFSQTKLSFHSTNSIRQHNKVIFKYSLPILLYFFVSASVINLDKPFIHNHFSSEFFIEYVYNFQFSYIINIISVVMGLYNLPIFCELLAEKKTHTLKSIIYSNYALVIFASVMGGGVAYAYAHITGIDLSSGFFFLCIAFMFTNLFTINVCLFEALKKSSALFVLTLFPVVIFWILMYIIANTKHSALIYVNIITYNVLAWVLSSIYLYFKVLK